MMAKEDKLSVSGPALEGWQTYQAFAESVKSNLRYVRYSATNKFLEDILNTCTERKTTIPRGTLFWRARLGHDYERITREDGEMQVCWDEERPYSQENMKPIANWQNEGRVNPRGIPYLYLGTTRDTALAEVRPWIGSILSVAQFEICRDLSLIDCSKHHSMEETVSIVGNMTSSREDGIWTAIDQAFATPVTRDDQGGDYIPTQIIAELFKSEGYDGVVYKSLLSKDGFNIALFNLNDACVVNCELYKAKSIKFDFQSEGTQYFVQDKS